MNRRRNGVRALVVAGLAVVASGVLASGASAGKSISPTSWDFGDRGLGTTSPPKSFTLTVTCGLSAGGEFCQYYDYYNPAISTTGDFAVLNEDCPAMMVAGPPPDAPSQSCTVNVTFTPTLPGLRTGTLSTGGPTASLTGHGPPQPVAVTPATGSKKCKKKKKKCKKKKR